MYRLPFMGRTMPDRFTDFCDRKLWRAWLNGALEVSPLVRQTFELSAAPEPYLRFGSGDEQLTVLTTNPGRVEKHQLLQTVFDASDDARPLRDSMDYETAAASLGTFYSHENAPISSAARKRLRRLIDLAATIAGQRRGTRSGTSIVQVEALPFHSDSLAKARALQAVEEPGLLAEYVAKLREFLSKRTLLVLSAGSTRESYHADSPWSAWVHYLANMASLARVDSTFHSLVTRNAKTTCAAWVTRQNGICKALVLMMGGNYLPGRDGLKRLADAMSLG
jgi:hypothetical protein